MNRQAKRRKALQTLRETGMTDAEIEEQLGRSIPELLGESEPKSVTHSNTAKDEILDVEIVSIDESTDTPMKGGDTRARGVPVSLPARLAGNGTDQTYSLGFPPQYSEEWWQTASPEVQAGRCRGHSTRTGERCRKSAIAGSTVCRFHGGAAPQVKAAARARLENAADRMARNLLRLGEQAESEAVQLGATNSALDRAGILKPTQVEIGPMSPKPYEEIFEDIGGGSREESRARRGFVPPSVDYPEHDPDFDRIHRESSSLSKEGDTPTHTQPVPPTQRNTPAQRSSAGKRVEGTVGGPQSSDSERAVADSAESAVYLARRANEASGALPAQRAIESGHRRYRAHRRSIY